MYGMYIYPIIYHKNQPSMSVNPTWKIIPWLVSGEKKKKQLVFHFLPLDVDLSLELTYFTPYTKYRYPYIGSHKFNIYNLP